MAGSSALDGGSNLEGWAACVRDPAVAAPPADGAARCPLRPARPALPARPSNRPRQQPAAGARRRRPFPCPGTGAACSMRSTPAIGRRRRPGLPRFRRASSRPVAKAELYTAKGSPVVDLASLQSLIAAGARASRSQPARADGAQARGEHAAAGRSRKADRGARLGAGPLPRPPGSGRARRGPAARLARPADQGRRCHRRRGAARHPGAAALGRSARRGRPPASPSSIMCSGSTWMPAGWPIPGGRARLASGRPGRVGVRPRLLAARRLQRRLAPPSGRPRSSSDQRELRAGGYYWAARAEQASGRPASVEPLLKAAATTAEAPESFYGLLARETLGMSTRLGADPFVAYDPAIDRIPTSSGRSSWRRSASLRSPSR